MQPEKHLSMVAAEYLDTGALLEGYEIHIGETEGPDTARPWLRVGERMEGAASADGRVTGCYLHGIFASDAFRRAYLGRFGGYRDAGTDYGHRVEQALDALAAHLEESLDLDLLFELAAAGH